MVKLVLEGALKWSGSGSRASDPSILAQKSWQRGNGRLCIDNRIIKCPVTGKSNVFKPYWVQTNVILANLGTDVSEFCLKIQFFTALVEALFIISSAKIIRFQCVNWEKISVISFQFFTQNQSYLQETQNLHSLCKALFLLASLLIFSRFDWSIGVRSRWRHIWTWDTCR